MADIVSIAIALDTGPVLTGTRQVTQALHQVETAEKAVQQQTATMERVTHQAAQALQQESQAARATGQTLQSTGQHTHRLAQQDQALAAASTQATQALQRLAQAAQQAGSAAQKAGQDTSAMGQSARRSSGLFQEMANSLQAMVAAGIGLAVLRRGLEDVVQAALKQEQLKTTLVAITGSQKAAGEANAFARAEAERLGLANNVLIESYGRLLAATKGTSLEGQKARETFQNYNEVMRALNLSTDDQRNASRALNQILSQQAIQGDELRNELGSRIPLTQYLVEATNGAAKSQQEFNKMMEEGKFKGEAAIAVMYNLGIILQREIGQKGADAANGAGAALARFDNAVEDLKVALGQGLLPAVSQVARALAEFIRQGEAGAKTFGGAFTDMILQMTSALIGLAGAAIVTGKYIAALGAGIAFGPEAWNAGWEDVKQTVADTLALQEKLISGGFATPAARAARTPSQDKMPVVPAGGDEEKKARGKAAADRESTKLASEQLSLRTQINDAYDKATNSERQLTALHLQRAKFSEQEQAALLARFDETKLYEEANRLKDERLALDKQLQEALDKQNFTERELLQKKMEHLLYTKEEMALNLKRFDQEKQIREEKERQVEAEKEAVRATEEHLRKVEQLMDKLEPQRRRMSRAEQLQGTMSELAGETSDPFTLAQADIKRESTLAFEEMQDQLKRLEDLGESVFGHLGDFVEEFVFKGKLDFKGMMDSIAQDLFRFATQTLMQSATKKGGWLEMGLDLGLKALSIVGGGGMPTSGTLPTTEAAYLAQSAAGRFSGRAAGGPVISGTPYVVGERGPELFVPTQRGMVLPHGQGVAQATVVNVHVTGVQDAQSFVQSRGAVSRAMMSALAQARQQM